MKALLLVESDRIADLARFYLRPLGFETLRYRNPVKAVDNLEEIDPDALVVSARDFPRHWKVIAQAIRAFRDKDECVIVLLKGESFPLEEAAKATHIGVNGVLRDDLDDRREQARFQELLRRYIVIDDERAVDRISPSAWDRLDFMFAHPRSLAPIAGKLETISPVGLSFIPDMPALVSDLSAGDLLEDCSLRVGGDILSLGCKVARAERVLGLTIEQMADDDRSRFEDYLAACPEREMKAILDEGRQ
jgi:Anthranilate/para-aminobenzoate synthases component II